MTKKANPLKELAKLEFIARSPTIAQISEKLELPLGTVSRWCFEGGWTRERDRLQQEVEVVPNPRPPAVGEENELFARWENQALEHEKNYSEIRKYASAQIRSLVRRTAQLQAQRDIEALESDAISLPLAKAASEWGRLLDICVKGERTVTGAEYFDLNRAIRLVKFFGYDIIQAPIEATPPTETPTGISRETADRILENALGVDGSGNFN